MSELPDPPPLAILGLAEALAALRRTAARRDRLPAPFADATRASRTEWARPAAAAPPQGPLIATGHQANLWHPGILVKFILAERLADALGGGVLRTLVDQDLGQITPLEFPCRSPGGELAIARVPLDEPDVAAPISRRRPIRLAVPPKAAPALPAVAAGLEAISASLHEFEAATSASEQVARSLASLTSPWLPARPFLQACRMLASPLGLALLDAIAEEPRACAACFNEAIRGVPGAARPLRVEEDLIEAPLWRLDGFGSPRQRVFLPAGDAPQRRAMLREAALAEPPRVAPRGLLMTGLLRTATDLFIHGRGGWHYDRATEAWFKAWLGIDLPPMAMATADLRLPLDGGGAAASPLPRRRWHDPFAGVRGGPSDWKQVRLAAIAAHPRRSAARRAAFLALQRDLAAIRQDQALASPPRRPDPAAIAARRDWAFPLHPPAAIDRLAESAGRLAAAIGAPSSGADRGPLRPSADPAGRGGCRGTRRDR